MFWSWHMHSKSAAADPIQSYFKSPCKHTSLFLSVHPMSASWFKVCEWGRWNWKWICWLWWSVGREPTMEMPFVYKNLSRSPFDVKIQIIRLWLGNQTIIPLEFDRAFMTILKLSHFSNPFHLDFITECDFALCTFWWMWNNNQYCQMFTFHCSVLSRTYKTIRLHV